MMDKKEQIIYRALLAILHMLAEHYKGMTVEEIIEHIKSI